MFPHFACRSLSRQPSKLGFSSRLLLPQFACRYIGKSAFSCASPIHSKSSSQSSGFAYVALGSNFGGSQRIRILEAALSSIRREVGPIDACSCLYESLPGYDVDPRGKAEHDMYLPLHLNAVVRVRMQTGDPQALLELLHKIEAEYGRDRSHQGRRLHRTVDLDLLLVQEAEGELLKVNSEKLILPHPRLAQRNFVLFPLCDISPDLVHPVANLKLRDLLRLNLKKREEALRCLSSLDAAAESRESGWKLNTPTYTLDGNLAVPRRCFAPNDRQLWTLQPAEFAVGDTLRWVEEVERRHEFDRRKSVVSNPQQEHSLELLRALKESLKNETRNRPRLMGILNVTPDSFSDGCRYTANADVAAERARQMMREGAAIIDVGGEATNPFVKDTVSVETETQRVVPVIHEIRKKVGSDVVISVDTRRLPVAEAAISSGADMINDVTAGESDADLLAFVVAKNLPFVLMHSRGTPATMNDLAKYDDVVEDVARYLSERVSHLMQLGLARWRLVVDPGLGFAKTAEQNFELLNRLKHLQERLPTGIPLLIGHSRKRFIGSAIGEGQTTAGKASSNATDEMEKRDIAGLAVTCWSAASCCVDFLRIHNVEQTALVLRVMQHLTGPKTEEREKRKTTADYRLVEG
ncbi:hypothetical protein Efla_006238 [Eimeria flavescens]